MIRNALMIAALGSMLGAGVVYAQEAQEAKPARFDVMVRVMALENGTLTATRPGQAPEQAISYKAYPYGTRFVASDGARFRVHFSDLTYAVVRGPADFVARATDEWRKVTVEVTRGDLNFSIGARTLPDQFEIVTPLGAFTSLQGMSKLHIGDINKDTITEKDFSFRTLSGTATYSGLHYKMGALTQANAFTALQADTEEATELVGRSGEVKMDLPMGNDKQMPFSLTPGAIVKITRARPKGSDNWVVSVLALYANGEAQNYFCYVENRGEGFATGELIAEMLPEEEDEAEEGDEESEEGEAEETEEATEDFEEIPDELESFGDLM